MPRPKMKIDAGTVHRAEEELEKIKESKLAIQLQGIIAAAHYPISQIADILHVSPRSIFRWVTKFQTKGVEGLRDHPKGHMKAKLSDAQKLIIEGWLINGNNTSGERTHWTLHKLKREIEKEFSITMGITPLWHHVRGMGLVLRKPRPLHDKADPEAQEAFKKN
jgi:transposase